MKTNSALSLSYNAQEKLITVHGDQEQKSSFLQQCLRMGFKFSLHVIIMKMVIMYPTLASALSTHNTMPLGGIEINGDEALFLQLEGVADQINAKNNTKTQQNNHNQAVYFGFNDGLILLGTSALTAFATGVGLNYLSNKISEHKPNPLYVYGAFVAMLASIYAMGSVPIIVPNIAALGAAYLCRKHLTPNIENMNEGYVKSGLNVASSALPILASGIAATTVYPSWQKAAITTIGVLIGSKTAQYASRVLESRSVNNAEVSYS